MRSTAWTTLFLLALLGCSSNEPASAPCAIGMLEVCTCADGKQSTRTCLAETKGFGACSCGGFAGAAGGAAGSAAGTLGVAGTSGVAGSGVAGIDAGADASMSVEGPGTVISEPEDESAFLFDQSQLCTYEITVAQSDLDTLNANPAAEQYVPAMLRFEGVDYGPIRMRYKGSVGAFLAPCTSGGTLGGASGPKAGKCSIKLAFDQVDPEGRFFGLKKLNFHSMNNDDSFLRERLGYMMFREMGVAAPRAMHARVVVNGVFEGLFILVEQVDGRFTRARFTEGGEGNLYKEVWPIHANASTYLAALESNRDESPSAQRMLDFRAAIGQGLAATEAWLDREYMLRYLAVDRVIVNDDGIFQWWCSAQGQGNNPGGKGNHNYYWYEAEHENRLWLLPWDLDHSFQAAAIVHVNPEWSDPGFGICTCGFGSSIPAACDPLTKHFIAWRADFDLKVEEFIAGPFATANVDPKLEAWIAQIDAAVQEGASKGGAPSYQGWQSAVQTLRGHITSQRTNRGYAY